MTGTYEASKKRGFTDCSTERFYVDYIEPGQSKKAPFDLRTDDQLSMLFKSESKSLLLRVIQRIVQFEKGSVNILMEKDEKSCEVELSNMSTQSSVSSNCKSSNAGVCRESTRTFIPSHSRKRQKVKKRRQDPKRSSEIKRLKELLLKADARLSEDGKSIKCLLCGKSPKLDNCKRSKETSTTLTVFIVVLLRLLILKLHKLKSKTSLGQLKSDKREMKQTQQKY